MISKMGLIMKKITKILAILLISWISLQTKTEFNASPDIFKQFLQKGAFAFLPESCQKYRIPLVTVVACGAIVKLVKDWPETKYHYYSIKRRLLVAKQRDQISKLTRENAIYEVPLFERVPNITAEREVSENAIVFHNAATGEMLIFNADNDGIVQEIKLLDLRCASTHYKIVNVKTSSLKLENIAGAGCLGNYLKIAFAPNEIIGCFDGFEDGKEIKF